MNNEDKHVVLTEATVAGINLGGNRNVAIKTGKDIRPIKSLKDVADIWDELAPNQQEHLKLYFPNN